MAKLEHTWSLYTKKEWEDVLQFYTQKVRPPPDPPAIVGSKRSRAIVNRDMGFDRDEMIKALTELNEDQEDSKNCLLQVIEVIPDDSHMYFYLVLRSTARVVDSLVAMAATGSMNFDTEDDYAFPRHKLPDDPKKVAKGKPTWNEKMMMELVLTLLKLKLADCEERVYFKPDFQLPLVPLFYTNVM